MQTGTRSPALHPSTTSAILSLGYSSPTSCTPSVAQTSSIMKHFAGWFARIVSALVVK